MIIRKKSSEVGITTILSFGTYGRIPLFNLTKNLQMEVCFQFGDWDWVERSTADSLIEKGYVKGTVKTV